MRNYDTPVRAIRHKVFAEVAKAGFESSDETLIHDIEAIPYNIVEEKAKPRKYLQRTRRCQRKSPSCHGSFSSPGKQSRPSDRRSCSQQYQRKIL